MNIEEKLKKFIVEQLEVSTDKVVPEASFVNDLGADSLDLVELVMALEEVLGEEIPDDEAEKIQAVQDVTTYIKDHLKTKHFHLKYAQRDELQITPLYPHVPIMLLSLFP